MDNHNLENNIKESFEYYSPDLNHDEIWDNIEPHLKKKKKRRFFFIWFFGGIALLGLFLANQYFWSGNANEKQVLTNTSPTTVDTKTTADPVVNSSSKNSTIETSIQKEQTTLEKESLTKLDTKRLAIKKPIPLSYKTRKSPSSFKNEIIIAEEVVSPEQELVNEKSVVVEEILAIPSEEETPSFETILEEEIPEVETEVIETAKTIDPFEESLSTKKKMEDEESKKKKITKPLKNKLRFIFQPNVSAIAPIKRLTRPNSFGEDLYLEHRKDNEKQLEAFAIGINIIAQTRRGFVMTTGIEVQRLNSRYSFTERTEEQNVTIGAISIVENAFGETIRTTSGPKVVTRRTERIQRFYNHHTFVNVPIGIGKYWNKPKYDIRLATGLDFNIYHNFKGLIQGQFWDLDMRYRGNDFFEQTFKRKTGMGFWLSTEFHKSVNKKFSWSIAPRIQIPFSKITQDDYVIEQRFMKISLTLGANFLIQPEPKRK